MDMRTEEHCPSIKTVKLVKIENPIVGYTPLEKSLLPTRNYCRTELFKGRSFKVSWSKGFTFTSIAIGRRVNISTLESIDPHDNGITDERLLQELSAVAKNTEVNFEDGIPCCRVTKSKSLLREIVEIASNESANEQEKYYGNVWRLLLVLWDKSLSASEAKMKFSQWLECTIENNMEDDLEIGLWNRERAVGNILTYLSGHKIDDAAQVALRIDMMQVSLLIGQINSTVASRRVLKNQIAQWINTMASDLIGHEIFKLYLILGGISTTEGVNICESLDWLRCLGMFLWYVSPPAATVRDGVKLYEDAFTSFAKHPFPPYSKDLCGYYDVLYLIICLHMDKKCPVEKVIAPGTHTKDVLDYRLSWLLMQTFESLEVGTVSGNVSDHVHVNFATQLEAMGYYVWGVFVLLFVTDANVKKDLIMGMLHRNIEIGDECDRKQESVLVKNFRIPASWIENIKAFRTFQLEKYWECFAHLSNSAKWKDCHNIAIEYLVPVLLVNNKYKELFDLLNSLVPFSKDITNWAHRGGLLLDYINLRQTFSVYQQQNFNLIRFDFIEKVQDVISRLAHFPTTNDDLTLCASMMSKRSLMMLETMHTNKAISSPYAHLRHLENVIMPDDFKMNDLLVGVDKYCKKKCTTTNM